MKIIVITAFPNLFQGPINESILRRAQDKEIVTIRIFDLRNFTAGKHKQVDDYPYGGGPGMILKPEPFFNAIDFIKMEEDFVNPRMLLMTPQGETYTQEKAKKLSQEKELIFLCGHYKGVDERVNEVLNYS